MDIRKISAACLAVAFVFAVVSTVAGVPGLYTAPNVDEQMRLIDAYHTRWLISQGLVLVFLVLTTAGFVALSLYFRAASRGWLATAGAVAVTVGSVSGIVFLYLQTDDPRLVYGGGDRVPEALAYGLWLAGVLLYGIVFLRAGLPAWLGYLAVGGSIAFSVAFLLFGGGFVTPFLVAILELIIAIVLLRSPARDPVTGSPSGSA